MIEFKSIDDIVYVQQNNNGDLGKGGFAEVKLVSHKNFP